MALWNDNNENKELFLSENSSSKKYPTISSINNHELFCFWVDQKQQTLSSLNPF